MVNTMSKKETLTMDTIKKAVELAKEYPQPKPNKDGMLSIVFHEGGDYDK
jgi:hypothetical protein